MSARFDVFNEGKFIVIDSRSTPECQREQFFHELCHVIFHGGHQSNMYDPYRELLEWEADIFQLYAALPYHIIKQYDFSCENIVYNLATDFCVSKKLCEKRLLQIKNQLQQNYSLVAEQTIMYNRKEDKTNG